MDQVTIVRRKPREGRVSAWLDGPKGGEEEIFIRESVNRGRDVQTVSLTRAELLKILAICPTDN